MWKLGSSPTASEKVPQGKLLRGVRLAGGQQVGTRNSPAAQDVADYAVLRAHEGETLHKGKGEGVRDIQTGQAVLGTLEVQRILQKDSVLGMLVRSRTIP